MATIGYHPGSSTNAWDQTNTADSLNQRGYATAKMTEHGWAYQLNLRGGRISGGGTPRVKLAVWATDGSPQELLETTDEFNTGTSMSSVSTGATYTHPLNSVVQMRSGKRYILG